MERIMELGLLVVLSVLVYDVQGYQVCGTTLYSTKYCYDGYYCCYDNTRCCKLTLSSGAVAGIVVGCLVATGLVVTFIVAWVCCRKNRASGGTVMIPASGPQMSVVSTCNQATAVAAPAYGQQTQGYPVNQAAPYQSPQAAPAPQQPSFEPPPPY